MSVQERGGSADSGPVEAFAAGRGRRSGSGAGRRIIFILLGLVVLLGSIAGFYLTSGAFDERTEVLVAAVDIAEGDIVSALDFRSELANLGDIPHVPWTEDAPFAFEGLVALEAVAAGSVVTVQMFTVPDSLPLDDQMEVFVPLDTGFSVTPVNPGDTVLLIDPGVEPTADDPGRPRQAMRSLELDDFDGESLRLLVPPEEWAEWRALPDLLGATPQVLPVALGGDPEDLAQRLNAIWQADWAAAVDAATPIVVPEPPEPAPGPGELEVRVALDAALAPEGLQVGDQVLLVDPGVPPAGGDSGRPRSVIGTLDLVLFDGTEVRLFVPPEEWARWSALPTELGSAPLALPIPDGSDVDAMIRRLDALWQAEWEARLEEVESAATAVAIPQPGEFLVTLPLDTGLSSRPPTNGDQVLILDPGTPGSDTEAAQPPQVIEWRILEGWDGSVLRFWAEADRWAYYTFLADRLGAPPLAMVVTEPVTDDTIDALLREVNGALLRWYPNDRAGG